jgi:hypothetical protein
MTSMIDEILGQIPADDVAAQLGTDPDTAMDAARKTLPALLGGLSRNVAAGGGDAPGAAIRRDHDGRLLDRSNPLAAVDTGDGQKIVGHIFGDQQDRVVQALGATSSGGSSIFSKLLPLLAPLVMAWLAKRVDGAIGGGGAATGAASGAGSGGLDGLLGGLLGGGGATNRRARSQRAGTGSGSSESGGLGDVLGGLLGGEVERGKSSMPDLGGLFDILGDSSR